MCTRDTQRESTVPSIHRFVEGTHVNSAAATNSLTCDGIGDGGKESGDDYWPSMQGVPPCCCCQKGGWFIDDDGCGLALCVCGACVCTHREQRKCCCCLYYYCIRYYYSDLCPFVAPQKSLLCSPSLSGFSLSPFSNLEPITDHQLSSQTMRCRRRRRSVGSTHGQAVREREELRGWMEIIAHN